MLIRYLSQQLFGAINIIFFLFFLFQEIICQKNNVSMTSGCQLNSRHSKLLFHLMLFILCFPLESLNTLLLYFTELDAEFWKSQQQICVYHFVARYQAHFLPCLHLSVVFSLLPLLVCRIFSHTIYICHLVGVFFCCLFLYSVLQCF